MDLRSNAHFTVPDDAESSSYRYIIVASKRARQLQSGSRSFLPTTTRKATVTAMEEVRRGLVKWDDPAQQALIDVSEE